MHGADSAGKLWFAGLLLVCLLPAIWAGTAAADEVDQLIIRYQHDVRARMSTADPQLMARMAERSVTEATGLQVSYRRAMAAKTSAHVLRLPYVMSVEQAQLYAQQIMQQQPEIEYAEPDYWRYALRTVPDDLVFNQQWYLLAPADFPGAANVVNAWDLSKGSADIVVAVLDSGVTDHLDLRANLVGGAADKSGYDMVFDDPAGDGDGRDADPSDPGRAASAEPCVTEADEESDCWHGTHVSGLIAARPDNGKFIAGVGWNTRLSMVRFMSGERGYLSDQVDAMMWAGGEKVAGVPDNDNPARILNLSVGSDGFSCSRTEQNAVDTLINKGVSIVVAAGNKNHNVAQAAPANCDGVISVTGVMMDGARAPFANYGALNDIAAPAESIVSTSDLGEHKPAGDSTAAISGTSQAAPQVAAVLALMLAANDKLLDEHIIAAADLPGLLEDKLKRSARKFPATINGSAEPDGCNKDQATSCVCTTATCGAGLLDALQAVKAVSSAPVANTGGNRDVAAGEQVMLDGSGSTDDAYGGKITAYQWQQVSGTDVELSAANQSGALFTAPAAGSKDTQLTFRLTVTDDVGLQDSATVVITVPGKGGGGGSIPLSVLLGLGALLLLRTLNISGLAAVVAARPFLRRRQR